MEAYVNKKCNLDDFNEVATFTEGMSFGELALTTSKARYIITILIYIRAAGVIAKTECHFATMQKRDFDKVLKQIEIKKLNEVTNFMLSLPCFRMCTKRSMHKIKFYFQKLEFSKTGIVYNAGDPTKYVYIIKKGQFEVN